MDVVADLPADPQAAEPVQVSEGALDNPALSAESGAVFSATSCEQWLHAERADEAAVLVVVVAAVTEHDVGAAPRSATLAPQTGGTAWSSGMSWVTSLRLPPVRVTASGMPVASVIRWCLLPVLPRSTGLRPVLGPLSML